MSDDYFVRFRFQPTLSTLLPPLIFDAALFAVSPRDMPRRAFTCPPIILLPVRHDALLLKTRFRLCPSAPPLFLSCRALRHAEHAIHNSTIV